MMKRAAGLVLFLAFTALARGEEPFTEVCELQPGIWDSSTAWGDYDNDGDLDVALCGVVGSAVVGKIYRNDGSGAFVDVGVSLAGGKCGALDWGDYDNDGDLDLAIAGGTTTGAFPYSPVCKVYRNDGAGVFTDIGAGLAGVCYASLAWGDYDNDGDLDLAVAGNTGSGDTSVIYRNDGGTFVNIGAGLVGVCLGCIAWGDYDGDGDLDIALTGNPYVTKVYRNDGGTFADAGAGLPGLKWSRLAWGDYDNDGDPDLALSGSTSSGRLSEIYRNDGGAFVGIGASLTAVNRGSFAWGDFDNDGDLDIALTGGTGTGNIASVYRNEVGTFTDIGAGLAGVGTGPRALAWGDYDNDGHLDLAIRSRIYCNNGDVFNTPPSAPTGLSAAYTGTGPYDVTFSWNAGADTETPQGGLAYSLRVGTSSGGDEVSSGMADSASGYRHVPAIGNAQKMLSWTLKGLPAGTYYWSVQAIDTAFAGSAWAAEQVAWVPGPGITVTLGLSAAVEGDGALAGAGTVTVPTPVAADLTVTLASDDTTEATVPSELVIPAGFTSVDFDVTVVDDTEIDGDQTVTISASATAYSSGNDSMLVNDNETRTITVTLPAVAIEGDGALIGAGIVSIPGAWPEDLVISLQSSDTTELTVPLAVTILQGETSAAFDLAVEEDGIYDATQTATVTAMAAGWMPGSVDMDILDNQPPAGTPFGGGCVPAAGGSGREPGAAAWLVPLVLVFVCLASRRMTFRPSPQNQRTLRGEGPPVSRGSIMLDRNRCDRYCGRCPCGRRPGP